MKKILALLLASCMIVCMFSACGGSSEATASGSSIKNDSKVSSNSSAAIEEAASSSDTDKGNQTSVQDIIGSWYDTNSFNFMNVIESNSIAEYYHSPTQNIAGKWSYDNNVLSLSGLFTDLNGDLQVQERNGIISLTDETREFVRLNDLPWVDFGSDESVGDDIQISNVEIGFLDELPYDDYSSHDSTYDIGSSQVYAEISFDIINNTKEAIEMPGGSPHYFNILIDYNDGFVFSNTGSDIESISWYTDGSVSCARKGYAGYGNDVSVAPLEQKRVSIYIPCAEILSTDTESPLSVDFILTYNSPIDFYKCIVR